MSFKSITMFLHDPTGALTGAEMIVMGAYGHSRLREAVIGGVTRTILRQAPVPVLLAN